MFDVCLDEYGRKLNFFIFMTKNLRVLIIVTVQRKFSDGNGAKDRGAIGTAFTQLKAFQ